MSMFPALTARYKALPRAGRWGVWFVLAVAAYFGAVEPALDWSSRSAISADRLRKALDARARLGDEAAGFAGAVERGVVAVGTPKTPRAGLADPSGYLNQKTADIAGKHGVTIKRRTRRSNSTVNILEWNGSKVERVTLELVVECDTQHFVAFLKDMEASPDITTISSLRLIKVAEPGVQLADSTTMQITLVPEMWTLARAGGPPAQDAPPAAQP
ncbi:MAG: hypothetical protein K2X91_09395, partial [Thermoleophilia bacterium]|nr:hypothetical protein [Thermoleophilia bacterium]